MKNSVVLILCVMMSIFNPLTVRAGESPAGKERPFRIGISLGYTFAGYKETTYDPVTGQPIYFAYYPTYQAHRAYLEYALDAEHIASSTDDQLAYALSLVP
ncbi:hypothetical protein AGMMS50293_13020 [Spirochaetia bacterium]|nr:hypothetical protein AGMMS50293_13020 [Spirochaetia bacterium]